MMNKILIVEDEFSISNFMKTVLEGDGYTVEVATCAAQARAALEKMEFSAMLLDLGLPDADGLELLRALLPERRRTQIYQAEPYVLAFTVLYAVLLVVFLFAVTPLRYIRWHYELRPDFLELKYGIIWRKHIVVPFIRVQNTDTKQGPILRAFGLASVTVSTAAGSMEIPGLLTEEADSVRDRAAEFARLAREDV